MYSKQRFFSRIVIEKSSKMVRHHFKSGFFLTGEFSFRSEKSLPRVAFVAMFWEMGSLPWVLLWKTDKDKGGEIEVKESRLKTPSES